MSESLSDKTGEMSGMIKDSLGKLADDKMYFTVIVKGDGKERVHTYYIDEENMTWRDWLKSSKFDTKDFRVEHFDGGDWITRNFKNGCFGALMHVKDDTYVSLDDIIEDREIYLNGCGEPGGEIITNF